MPRFRATFSREIKDGRPYPGRGCTQVDSREYDAVVIGAGQAGGPLSRALAKAGWRTALVEREHVGGTCINEGCTPSKTMIASARVAHVCKRAADYGVRVQTVRVDMQAVRRRKRDLVESWRRGEEEWLRSTKNLDLLVGEATFLGPHRVKVRSAAGAPVVLEAGRVFINTGCRPAIPRLAGLDNVPFLTSTTIMDLDVVPEHLLVLGGGHVAVEFSQMFRRFGSKVTVIARRGALLSREDPDVAQAVADILTADGVDLVLGARVDSVERAAGGISLQCATTAGTRSLVGSHLLVATGRTPNTEALAVHNAGLELDEHGYIPVNERLETGVAGIYALGDVHGGPAFTHISYDDFRVVRANLLEGREAVTTGRLVPYVIFMDPQLGRVGLTEREAREQAAERGAIAPRILRLPMDHVARALEIDEPRGFIKVVTDGASDRILGCAVLGVEGGELMSLLQIAMMGGVTASQLKNAVFAHPALAEAMNNLRER